MNKILINPMSGISLLCGGTFKMCIKSRWLTHQNLMIMYARCTHSMNRISSTNMSEIFLKQNPNFETNLVITGSNSYSQGYLQRNSAMVWSTGSTDIITNLGEREIPSLMRRVTYRQFLKTNLTLGKTPVCELVLWVE